MIFWVAVLTAVIATAEAVFGPYQQRLIAAGATVADARAEVFVPVAGMWVLAPATLAGPVAILAEFLALFALRQYLVKSRPSLNTAYRSIQRQRRGPPQEG